MRRSLIARAAVALAVILLAGLLGAIFRPPAQAEVKSASHRAAESPAPKRDTGISIAAVGDTMLGNTPELPSQPGAYLDRVSGQLKGGIVFGNLEGALTDISDSPKCAGGSSDCFAFRTPPRYARFLHAAGFTVMNDANNHFYDFGAGGEGDTVRALHRAGIAQTGRPGEITVLDISATKVALLGFAPYFNTAPLTDLPAARRLIRRAARRAAIVVCSIHAGAEGVGAQHVSGHEEHYLGEDRGNPERFAQMAIRAGADLILGSGPHVLRGMQIYRHRLIAYSLGNFSGFHNFAIEGPLGASAVLHVSLGAHGRFRAGRIASVRLVDQGRPVPDRRGQGARLIARLSREDFGHSGVRVGTRGRILTP
ncbi:MAG TPA: CapA family protein [Solirubrobacterales bacterium]|nr:CapA family protein [Solirubrobacterales bacterium]